MFVPWALEKPFVFFCLVDCPINIHGSSQLNVLLISFIFLLIFCLNDRQKFWPLFILQAERYWGAWNIYIYILSQGQDSQVSYLAFAGLSVAGLFCSVWSRMVIVLKFSVLQRCLFFDTLSGEHWALLFQGCVCACVHTPIGMSSLPVFSSKSEIYQARIKPRELTTVSFLGSQGPQVISLLILIFQSFLMLV